MTYKNNLVSFLSVLAEGSYLFLPYILLAQLCKTNPDQLLSLLGLILVVIVSFLFNFIIYLKPKKRITLISSNIFLIIIITLLALHYLEFFRASTLIDLFWNSENLWISVQAWLLLIFISIIAIRSMTLCNRRIYLKEAIARFEISIGFFIVTAIIAGALQVELREYFLTIIVGFLSNFLAMTLCKQTEPISSRYLLAGTLGITVFIGSLLALLNWGQTFLINISTWIYTNTLPFISGIFLGILKWLLTKGKYIKNDSPPNAAPSSNEGVVSGWELPLHDTQWLKYILWFLMGLIILFLVVILIILFIYLIKYLLKPKPNKYSKEEGLETEPSLFSLLVVKVKKLFIKLNLLFVVYLSKDISLERLYSYLLLWGEGKEMPRLQHETPYEYSQRLSLKYPQQNEYIRFITESYVAYQYGNIRQSRETRNTLNAYLKKLYFARK